MKHTFTIVLLTLLLAFGAQAQTTTPEPAPEPQYLITIGSGFSQYSDPHLTATSSFGVHVATGTYEITSLDMGTKQIAAVDANGKPITDSKGNATFTRKPVSTIRTGVQKVLTRQGPFTLAASGDLGLTAGDGSVSGSLSGGGTLAYLLPSALHLPTGTFAFASARILKAPNAAVADPATVQTAFTFGIGFSFGGK
jgi:hypothetical protein